MIFSAIAAVAIGWLLRNYWLAFMAGLAVSYASAILNWLVYADRPDLNDYQFRTVLAGFLAGALGVVVAFLSTAYEEYRAETRAQQASRMAAPEAPVPERPKMSTAMKRRLKLVDARAKRIGNDLSNLTFGLVDRWVNRESYRDAGRK
ncbi:hypothetical protein C3941_07785 [Kaistia algarum]|nr:hypothetical protein C3941_07785 [Kaistia algarum]